MENRDDTSDEAFEALFEDSELRRHASCSGSIKTIAYTNLPPHPLTLAAERRMSEQVATSSWPISLGDTTEMFSLGLSAMHDRLLGMHKKEILPPHTHQRTAKTPRSTARLPQLVDQNMDVDGMVITPVPPPPPPLHSMTVEDIDVDYVETSTTAPPLPSPHPSRPVTFRDADTIIHPQKKSFFSCLVEFSNEVVDFLALIE